MVVVVVAVNWDIHVYICDLFEINNDPLSLFNVFIISCYMMVEIWRIIQVYSKWFDRCTEHISEMNYMLDNNQIHHSLRVSTIYIYI
jgi:hypothetical protein